MKIKDIPFVFYTATYTTDEDEKFALNLGASAFIRKPAEPDVFVRKLNEVLKKAKTGTLTHPEVVPLKPSLYLTEYSKRVVAKLEEKMAELKMEILSKPAKLSRIEFDFVKEHPKTGYDIMEARILGVADVVEAMSSHRPYRPALGIGKALEEISDKSGSLYDPDVAAACLKVFKKGFSFEKEKEK